ncbi:MAG TPA: hypothetical protein V6D00_13435 [Pantanalinema sp.]
MEAAEARISRLAPTLALDEAARIELVSALRDPAAARLWDFLETACRAHGPLQAALRAGVDLDAAKLQALLGPAYEAFVTDLHTHLEPPGAVELLATLNDRIGPRLPFAVDFLGMLQPHAQARVLDQVAWRWARSWAQTPQARAIQHQGMPLPPLLEYEVLNQLTLALKPLVGNLLP